MRLRELRADVEKAMGSRFSPKAFHDFVLAQGLLPPHLLRKVVFEEFVAVIVRDKIANLVGAGHSRGKREVACPRSPRCRFPQ